MFRLELKKVDFEWKYLSVFLIAILLQGCDRNQIGKELSKSFDPPSNDIKEKNLNKKSTTKKISEPQSIDVSKSSNSSKYPANVVDKNIKTSESQSIDVSKSNNSSKSQVNVIGENIKTSEPQLISAPGSVEKYPIETNPSKSENPKELDIPFDPQPYRITIKLSGANPSAPAETLTRALRKAGVKFEVERIELVESPLPIQTFSERGSRR